MVSPGTGERRKPDRVGDAQSAIEKLRKDDPPALMNGSGSPVTGMIPIVIPMLTKTWKVNMAAMPRATRAPNRSRAVGGDHQQSPNDHQEGGDHEDPADESQLFADRGEDEVGALLGDILEVGLLTLEETFAGELARAHRKLALTHVPTDPGRVELWVDQAP